VRGSGRCPARAALALTGLVLTVAGCGHVLPLGLSAIPVPSRLASAIVLQPALVAPSSRSLPVQGPPSPATCPAGYATLPAGDQPPGSAGCYRKLGTPATFMTAAVTVFRQPAGPHGQPAQYVLRITLPAAGAAALTAITTNVAEGDRSRAERRIARWSLIKADHTMRDLLLPERDAREAR
jgi:hypothetical protein